MTLQELKPTRFLVSAEGEAISFRQWEARGGHPVPICIWVRNDGWMLACPIGLDIIGRNLWQKEWVGVWNLAHGDVYQYHGLTGDDRLADWDQEPEYLTEDPCHCSNCDAYLGEGSNSGELCHRCRGESDSMGGIGMDGEE